MSEKRIHVEPVGPPADPVRVFIQGPPPEPMAMLLTRAECEWIDRLRRRATAS